MEQLGANAGVMVQLLYVSISLSPLRICVNLVAINRFFDYSNFSVCRFNFRWHNFFLVAILMFLLSKINFAFIRCKFCKLMAYELTQQCSEPSLTKSKLLCTTCNRSFRILADIMSRQQKHNLVFTELFGSFVNVSSIVCHCAGTDTNLVSPSRGGVFRGGVFRGIVTFGVTQTLDFTPCNKF